MRNSEDSEYSNVDIFRLTGRKEILRHGEHGEIESSFYLVIGDEPEKHLRLLESTSSSASKVMPVCFSAKGDTWKLKASAVYSVQGLKRKIYSGILTNSSSGKTVNRIVSADDKGDCAKLFESREYIREEESNSEPPFTISNMLNLETVIEIKDGNQVENWLIFRDRTGLAVRYHENDSTVFSLANKNDYEYSSWIR
uniref:hypothetical protein n=1 Tax=Candidatus Electronema sp. TaxID=2698783 RepID=UPI0040569452